MSLNYFEENLLVDLENKICSSELHILASSESYFTNLEKHYPIKHNQIDWEKLRIFEKSYEKNLTKQLEIESFIKFFRLMSEKYHLNGEIVWVGDSATDFAISGSIEVMMSCLNRILEIPQHHYFIGSNYIWCLCFTFEGEMFFGVKPD